MGGGDAEVDAIRTVVEEGRRRNRGRRGRNGRVDAEVDAVKPPEHRGAAGFVRSSNTLGTRARVGVANTKRTRERAPTVWFVLVLCTLTSPRSHSGSVTDGKTGEEGDK